MITLRVWYILSLVHVTISVNRSARVFKRVYFSDFYKRAFYDTKKSAATTFTFFYMISACRTIQLRCNLSCGISKRDSSREKHVARNFHYGELHDGGSRVSSEKRESEGRFSRSLERRWVRVSSSSGEYNSSACTTAERTLTAATGMRNTADRRFLARGTGSGFYSRERAPRKPTARPPSDSGWELTRARFYSDLSGFYQVSPTWLARTCAFHPF